MTAHRVALDAEGRAKLNLGCGADVRDGWVNLDGFSRAPGVLRHDMLKTPWPFVDAMFDHIEARGVIEHIPVLVQDHNGTGRDVIFDVFEEAWRVLKPGGTFEMMVPWAHTDSCHDHIQHYRAFLPNTFNVWAPGNAEPWYTHARFVVTDWRRTHAASHAAHKWRLRVGKSRLGLTDHVMTRFPWTRRLLSAPAELRLTLTRADADGSGCEPALKGPDEDGAIP